MFDLFSLYGPALRLMDAERAHRLTVWALGRGLAPGLVPPGAGQADEAALALTVWGRQFRNPVGLAAGFDKNAEAVAGALALGFGFVEAGTVTPRPQAGNPRPRLFRLAADRAVVNRMGFNNDGMERVAARLQDFRAAPGPRPGPVGINIGKNKDSTDAAEDYRRAAARLGPLADYIVINVSSPNTPGLRDLQAASSVRAIVRATQAGLGTTTPRPPVLLKIAPDLADADLDAVVEAALAEAIDGFVIANTTIGRPAGLEGRHRTEAGGLSGRPLFDLSTRVLARAYRRAGGRVPFIGVGGIASGADAYAKIRAGASLVQLYSALVYDGPALIGRIKRELAARLAADGFAAVTEAVGTDAGRFL